ncbi:MAG: cysteine-rich KTR domain-containing protein [Lachnospiraceae bacterium]
MENSKWVLCPVCGNKTRLQLRADTELKNFPLYCPKCKKETIINAQDMKITLSISRKVRINTCTSG